MSVPRAPLRRARCGWVGAGNVVVPGAGVLPLASSAMRWDTGTPVSSRGGDAATPSGSTTCSSSVRPAVCTVDRGSGGIRVKPDVLPARREATGHAGAEQERDNGASATETVRAARSQNTSVPTQFSRPKSGASQTTWLAPRFEEQSVVVEHPNPVLVRQQSPPSSSGTRLGLVPADAVQQYDSGEVLMLAWMNDEALLLDAQHGGARAYFSRSGGRSLGQG